jgi:hypothetical protein
MINGCWQADISTIRCRSTASLYFVIFAEMKKYSTTIFLSLLFILACIYAYYPAAPVDTAGSSEKQAISSSISFPGSGIEYSNIQYSTAFNGHYHVQKAPVCSRAGGNSRIPVIADVLNASTVFEAKELFDNTYLSHNYPSHNFW